MQTKTLYCYECHKLFVFSFGEQSFYQKMKLNTPRHCPKCRKLRKDRYADPYYGWKGTMCAPAHVTSGHTRIHYAPYIVGGMRG